ncbi:MAG TPA: hypothetical protein VLA32_04695 [Anaerolineales bacterium]|jgi:hypothetical protein|nr:hypothetical protein [Anaerolineales bacterium]
MAPVVHGLENKYSEQMNFVFLDMDNPETKELRDELGFQYNWRPYFFFLNSEGEMVGTTLIGPQQDVVLEQAVIDVLRMDGLIRE